jgi:hypothetical protein
MERSTYWKELHAAMTNDGSAGRGLWLTIIVLTALVAALATSLAFTIAKASAPVTLTAGGSAFVTAVGLGISVWKFLRE